MPNFMAIGQTITDMRPLFDIRDGGCPPSWFLKIEFLTAPMVKMPNLPSAILDLL